MSLNRLIHASGQIVFDGATSETSSRSDADSTLQSNISLESIARSSADSTLTSLLNAEITARIAADSTLASSAGETGNFSCAISGPFPSTTTTLYMTRTEISSGKSIVTCRSSGFIGVGNNLLEEILIDATNVPTRFRPSEARYQFGIVAVESFSKFVGYFSYSNTQYWRLWKGAGTKFQNNGGDVGWMAFDMCWEGS